MLFYRPRKPLRHLHTRIYWRASRMLFWYGLRFEVVDTRDGSTEGPPTDFRRARSTVIFYNADEGRRRWIMRRVCRPLDRTAHTISVVNRGR